MDDKVKVRVESAKIISRALLLPEVRAQFGGSTPLLINPTVVCEWETTVSEVEKMLRIAQKNVKVKETLVCIREDDTVRFLAAKPSSVFSRNNVLKYKVHPDLTIGDVCDALLPEADHSCVMGESFGFVFP